MDTIVFFDTLGRDVRLGLRGLRRNPVFAVVAVLTLAIGIGANTAVFSVVNGVLLKPLPYPKAEDVVGIRLPAPGAMDPQGRDGGIRDVPMSASMLYTFADHNQTLEHIGVWFAIPATVTGLAEPEQVRTVAASVGLLDAIGVQPFLGRRFTPADFTTGNPETLILGYGYWQRRFGADRSVIGRRITVDSRPQEIVGVMPPGFRIVTVEPELISPLRFDRAELFLVPFNFRAVARLKPGVTMAEASADLTRLVPVWNSSWSMPPGFGPAPGGFSSWKITAAVHPLKEDVVGNVGAVLWVVMGTIGIVMLIACANVANLLLVRAESRQQELAVRAALGAGSWQIARDLLIENLLLALVGGGCGLAVACTGLRFLVAMQPVSLPRLNEITIDSRVLVFTLGISLLSGLIFGLIPAWKQARPWLLRALRSRGRSSSESREAHRARGVLVIVQVALALVLLVSAGLMIRTFQALRAVDPGFAPSEQLQVLRFFIPPSVVSEAQRVARIENDILDKLKAMPGVTSVAFGSAIPMDGNPGSVSPLLVEHDDNLTGSRAPQPYKFVSPGFFQTAGIRLIAGRDYTWSDLNDLRHVAIVSENLARSIWGSSSAALGKRIRATPVRPWLEVIGVVHDVRENGVDQPAPMIVYCPSLMDSLYQEPQQVFVARAVTFVIRSSRAGTKSFLDEVRAAIWFVNPNLPIASVRTMRDVYDQSMARTSFTLVMLGIAGTMALALGIIGIYGVISYSVSQRTREMGIRLALGAQPGKLRSMFVRYALALAGVGVIIGLAAALALSRLMRSLLFHISPLDPFTYVAVALVLAAAACFASYVPARRASVVNPVDALKAE